MTTTQLLVEQILQVGIGWFIGGFIVNKFIRKLPKQAFADLTIGIFIAVSYFIIKFYI